MFILTLTYYGDNKVLLLFMQGSNDHHHIFYPGGHIGKVHQCGSFFLFCDLCDFQFECKISTHPCRCQGTQGPQCPLISFEMPHSVPGVNADWMSEMKIYERGIAKPTTCCTDEWYPSCQRQSPVIKRGEGNNSTHPNTDREGGDVQTMAQYRPSHLSKANKILALFQLFKTTTGLALQILYSIYNRSSLYSLLLSLAQAKLKR